MEKVIGLFLLVNTLTGTCLANQLLPLGYHGGGHYFPITLPYENAPQLQQPNGHLLYNFWSTLAHHNLHLPNPVQFQLIPLNTHYVPQQTQNIYQEKNKGHRYENGQVNDLYKNYVHKFSKSDHDTIIIQSDEPSREPISKSTKKVAPKSAHRFPTPGFQRGQVEFVPRPENFAYGSDDRGPQANSNGFHRGHVEKRPGVDLPFLRKTSSEVILGFNRAAVEAPPAGSLAHGYKAAQEYKVVCYFANWAYYRKGLAHYKPENIDPVLCTHVVYAFVTFDRLTLTLKETDPAIDVDKKLIQRVVALKQMNPRLKVLVAVGGWSDSEDDKYSKLANSLSLRRMFARESVKFLRKYNLDGISLDWHYPVCWQSDCAKGPPSDKYAFSELIADLRSVYFPEGLIVAASLSGYKEVIDAAYDIPKLSEYLDFMNIMTYDYHGSWESRTGHLSPLYEGPPSEDLKPTYNSNFTMEYYVSKGADRSKLILGVPFYGQSFSLENKFDHSLGSLADGPGNPGEYTQQAGMLSFYEICSRVKNNRWTVRRDTSGSWGPYAFYDNQWVGFDDVDSIRRKARHVTTNGFGGMFAFTLDLDDFNNECCLGDQPLLRTISKELLGIPFNTRRGQCLKPTEAAMPQEPKPTAPPAIRTTSPPPTPTTPRGTCYYKTKPHPTDCNAYYVCLQEQEMLQRCPFDLHWNTNLETCDWPARAGCQAQQQLPTSAPWEEQVPMQTLPPVSPGSPCNSGQFFDGPACDQYYLCSNGAKKIQTCGPGLHWNDKEKLCDWPSKANCKVRSDEADDNTIPHDVLEPKCNNGEFSDAKRSCDIYYVCVHGHRVEFRCQPGLYWNNEGKMCDWPSNVKCTASSSPVEIPQQQTTIAAPVEASSLKPQFPWITQPTTTIPVSTTPSPQRPQKPKPDEIVRPPSTDLSGDYMIVCYFTNWAWYRPGIGKYTPADINPDLCTHIVYGFAVLDPNELLIKPHDTWADLDNKFYEQVVALKQKGKKVTVAIGGWNDSEGDKYSRLVNNSGARKRFIQHVVEFIQKYNFDGLDLDWEYPKCWQVECDKGPESDKPNFAAFVRELSEAFKPHGFLLSSAVSPSKTVIDAGYDVAALSRYLDWIAVMTYDFHGQWDKKTGHVAPLYFHEEDDFYYFNANYTMHYWIGKGAESRKLVMGIPLYGQSFTLINPNDHGLNAASSGGGTAGEYTRASGFLSYYEICNNIKDSGWTVVKDESGAMGPYAYKGNQWVSYDDVPMVRKKAELIRQLNLGGGMVWALDLDDFRNTCGQGYSPLLTTIRSVLGRKGNLPKVHVKKPPLLPPKSPQINEPIRGEDVHCDEQFRDDPKDCNKYYQCIFGRYVEQRCPAGTLWNKNRCDWPTNVKCQGEGGGGESRPSLPPLGTTNRPKRPPLTITTVPPILPVEQITFETSSYRPPNVMPSRYTTPASTTKDPEWCRLNWCPTEKPLPENKHELINIPPSDYKVVCYFTNWAWYRPGAGKYKPEDIDYNLCTHIAYGFAVLNPTTLLITPHDGWADIDNRFYKQATQLRKRGVKVVLALGGWNDSLGDKYSRLANDPEARRRFIAHAIEFIETWDFDGLDLDWEYPKCWQVDCDKGPASDKEAFASLVRELKDAFRPRGLLLSAAVSPNKKVVDEGYDVPTVSTYLDWVAVMTYDFHGQWDKKTGHNAPLYHHPESDSPFFNANYSINYWINQGTDPKKIVMGMPMYGQSFTLVDPQNTGLNSKSSGGAQAGEFTRSAGFLAYYEICNYVRKRGWTVVQDQHGAMGPYAYQGNQWVSFDDVDQIRRKSEYIKQMGLGGGMIWALDLDDFRADCGCEQHPLLRTINRVLRNYPVADPHCKLESTY